MLKNCFTLPMLPINAYFHSVYLDSMYFYQYAVIYVSKKEIQLLLEESYMLEMLSYGTFSNKE